MHIGCDKSSSVAIHYRRRMRLILYSWSLASLVVLRCCIKRAATVQSTSAARSSHGATLSYTLHTAHHAVNILPTLDQPPGSDCCGIVTPTCARPPASHHLLLFASVPNVASDESRRFPLRKQWAKNVAMMERKMRARREPVPAVQLRFVIGTQNMDADALAAIRAEAARTGDILLIDAPDRDVGEPKRRSATTLKVMHSMRYAVNNYVFDWFVRIGDDAYFRVDYFAELALEHAYPKEYAYIGYKFPNHVVPATDSTHNFIVGMGFILTYDLAQFTCRSYQYLHDGFPEDAVVGAWYVGSKVRVVHEPRFHDVDHVTTVAYAPCTNTSLLMHHMWTQDRWDAIDGDGLLKC